MGSPRYSGSATSSASPLGGVSRRGWRRSSRPPSTSPYSASYSRRATWRSLVPHLIRFDRLAGCWSSPARSRSRSTFADPVVSSQLSKAAFYAVAPLLLIGWAEVGPDILYAITASRPTAAHGSDHPRVGQPADDIVGQARKANAEHWLPTTGRSPPSPFCERKTILPGRSPFKVHIRGLRNNADRLAVKGKSPRGGKSPGICARPRRAGALPSETGVLDHLRDARRQCGAHPQRHGADADQFGPSGPATSRTVSSGHIRTTCPAATDQVRSPATISPPPATRGRAGAVGTRLTCGDDFSSGTRSASMESAPARRLRPSPARSDHDCAGQGAN